MVGQEILTIRSTIHESYKLVQQVAVLVEFFRFANVQTIQNSNVDTTLYLTTTTFVRRSSFSNFLGFGWANGSFFFFCLQIMTKMRLFPQSSKTLFGDL